VTPATASSRSVLGPGVAWRDLWLLGTKHRNLTLEMAKRELTDRYMGQILGTVWTILHPIVLILVYVVVFAYVFKVAMGGTREAPFDYTTYLLAGVIPWLSVQEALAKSSTVIVANANLVKQVIFPIEVLPVKTVLATLVGQIIFMGLLAGYVLISYHTLPWTYLLAPVLVVLQMVMMIGLCYAVSALGVFLRDVKDFVQVFSIVGVYLMPAFYLPESVPRLFRPILYVNPFSYLIWCYQDLLYFGRFVHWWAWLVTLGFSLAAFFGGYRLFRTLKVGFGNAL
jgi:lipopolysaccharide transport system permease protein